MIDLDELKVPAAMRPVVDEIIRMTDVVCAAVLDEEYADLARRATAKLARKRPSPLASGRRTTWAAGILYALGQVNYLSDPSTEPHLTADELSGGFGVAKATMGTKANLVRDLLKIDQFSAEFRRADVIAASPAVWFIEVDGLIMDARQLPLEIQTEAFRLGLIPYVPSADAPSQLGLPVASQAMERDGAELLLTHLLARSADLKRGLVDFAISSRCQRYLAKFMAESDDRRAELTRADLTDPETINAVDRFALQYLLPSGDVVVDRFLASRPDLVAADRELLGGWRDPVEGIFEIRRRDQDSLLLLNLIDDLEYRVYSNVSPTVFDLLPLGAFLFARLVPIRPIPDAWLTSGSISVYPESAGVQVAQVALDLALKAPHQ